MKMKKKLTLLHCNDIHGDFLATRGAFGIYKGGLSRLSGYVKKVRSEEENVILANAGDMFRGSVIDSEFMGLSTIEMMNALNPDVSIVGNHEIDYGIAHLLFLEKCARFPIINADLYITLNNARMFRPYMNIDIGGMRVMFIGLLTEEVISSTKSERVIGTYIDVEDAAKEVGIIADNYRTKDTDLLVLLTHIGIEKDRELASLLDPDWGVDMIIGGHSHTFMEEPEFINGIPIVQAGTGSGQIGRFDIVYDDEKKKITDLKWRLQPIDETTAPADPTVELLLQRYKSQTDAKYHRIVTSFARELTHPSRIQETEMGNLYADLLQEDSSFDIMFMGSGAIRKKAMGPIVEYQDMVENTPFDDQLFMIKVTGEELRRMITFVMRDEAWEGHTEFYQFSKGVRIVYEKSTHTLKELSFRGKPVTDGDEFLIAMQTYHYNNFEKFFNVPFAPVKKRMRPRVVATSVNNIVEEYFSTHQDLDAKVEGRIVILD
ncbi:MAG: 5'-nucleotidase C-terminal domain-containing protein [Clostridia bacterium]|nr:5'-nucleotidase C-terminal domain-containing protein [Clostridia bacterium]